ncbi:MAG: MiaB/RimO family radical SAM methylthiotransferase, partial [Nitrospirae bacterium]
IAEGCQRQCTFCVIPSIRGPLRSLPPEDILKRAEFLVSKGYREIIIVAQDTTSYGNDLGKGYGLKDLLKDMAGIDGQFWIKLLYLYPGSVDEALLELIAENKKICPYLDIPFQHTEKRLLRLMGRTGDREAYLRIVSLAKQIIKDLHLRTTFIVGFPTETEEEFQGLVSFVRDVRFDHLGGFKYSDEEGTKAYNLKPKVPEDVINKRYELLMKTQAEISTEKLRNYINKILTVLVDTVEEDIATARHPGQAPEIDGMVLIKDPEGLKVGDFVEVLVDDSTTYDLIGRLV